MRKVIFVGGTAYSGSTFFQLMLANDPKGFALGEIRWLFNPIRTEHINRQCGCGDPDCEIWEKIRRNGKDRIYETVFDMFPEIEFIVDSSKHPFWIQSQAENLACKQIGVEHVLIWKTPLEFALSTKKRNRLVGWDTEWIHYHRLYLSVIDGWRAIPYRALAENPHTLAAACEHVGISWYEGKEQYWHRTYHAFGGNHSATFHLYDEDRARAHLRDHHDKEKMQLYRRIYESKVHDQELEQIVRNAMANQPLFELIEKALVGYSVMNREQVSEGLWTLKFPSWLVKLRRLKWTVMAELARYRLRKYGKRQPV